VVGIFLLLAVAALAYARVFLLPVVLGFLLTLVFTPVRRFLERRGVPSAASATLIVGVLVTLLVAGLGLLAEPVQQWAEDAPEIGREVEYKLRGLLGSAREIMEAGEQVGDVAASDEAVPEVVVRQPGVLATLATQAPAMLGQAVFTLVLLLLLLASGDMFYEKLVHVMPTFKDKRLAMRIAHDVEQQISQYLFAITLINAGLGVAIGLAMWLIGMPNPLLFGVIAFLFNYVPFLGAIVGVVLATVVGFITFTEPAYALLAGGLYLALTSLEGQIVTPYLVGRRLEMNTVVVFLAIAFWAWLWSVMGMLVAVPLLVTVRVFSDHIPGLHPLGEFLAARHVQVADTDSGGRER
jgi:predicted PurR-regulated permease PerM